MPDMQSSGHVVCAYKSRRLAWRAGARRILDADLRVNYRELMQARLDVAVECRRQVAL